VRGAETLGECRDGFVKGRAPAQHGLERGHVGQRVSRTWKDLPETAWFSAQHDGAVLKEGRALSSLSAAHELAAVHFELEGAGPREAEAGIAAGSEGCTGTIATGAPKAHKPARSPSPIQR